MMPKPNARILLVDDTEQNRYILSRILQRAGFTVEECSTGKEALDRAQTHPDLIVLDVKLPDISGYEVCRRIKTNPVTAGIPVLQISAAFTSNESKVMALEGGADSYLTHPVDSTVLLATVKALLRLKQAETVMRQSAQEWQSTFDALTEGLVLLDNDNRVIRCNRAFTQMCGMGFRDVIGKDGREILRQCFGTAEFLADSSTRYRGEWQHDMQWYQVTVDKVTTKELPIGSIVVLTNITQRKMAEESLRNAEKLAATGRLAHTIAHEINNPLEALTNLIYLAQISSDRPDVHNYLGQALNELSRVARITKQVLSFHRESNKPVEMRFDELLDTVLALYSRQIQDKGVALKYEPGPADIKLEGFPGELRQVMANLVGNAIDATPRGGKIRIRFRRAVQRGIPGVRFTVCDSGPGIPENIREHIFEPFFTTKELKGSGLGLWLTSTIVTKHQGNLRFRSSMKPGQSGTCFSLFLPLAFDVGNHKQATQQVAV